MLYLSKEEVVSALKSANAPFVTDSSNECTDYTRNYIRSEIYPLLKKLSSNPDKSVMRACSNLLDDSNYLEKNADQAFSEFVSSGMKSAVLSNMHPSMLSRVIMKMVRQKTDKMPESVHIRAISEHLFNGGDFSISLPGAISFICSSGKCYIGSEEEHFEFEDTVVLHDGLNQIGELGIAVLISDAEVKDFSSNVYKFSTNKKIDCAIINGSLRLRTKKEGDSYTYGGIRRKLKKLFIDKKIPRNQRSRIPIIEDDAGILWIPGFPIRDHDVDMTGKFKWITFYEKT
jgi:tRNA(Ile)-lysidine synthase